MMNLELLMEQAQINNDLRDKLHYEVAEMLYTVIIRENPDPDHLKVAYHNRGFSKAELGRGEEAIVDFNKAIELDPKNTANAVTYDARGFTKYELGRFEEAIVDFDKAIELDPKFACFYNHRGLAKLELGRIEDAIVDFDKAIELDPKSSSVYHIRGSILVQQEKYLEALVDLDKAIELDSKSTHSYSWKGSALEAIGQLQEAKQCYQTALEQLQAIPEEKLYKNNFKHLIRCTEGLTRLGVDMSGKVNYYQKLAKDRGFTEKDW